MRVEMVIETEGVTTTVTREFEPDTSVVETFEGGAVAMHENPPLDLVAQAVAQAAITAHRIYP